MVVDHGFKPNKEIGPNLVNWANSGLMYLDLQYKDLVWDTGPIKRMGLASSKDTWSRG